MKCIYKYFTFIVLSILLFNACSSNNTSDKKEIEIESPAAVNETELLYDFIEKSGDIINSKAIPAILSADNVYNNLPKYLVLDIRTKSAYTEGHIDGAIQVNAKDLFQYFDKKVSPANHEKIVLACYSGQTAAYYASLLRLAGYGNVYSLKFGMSAWSKKISPNKWAGNTSSKYLAMLETKGNSKGKKGELPTIKTGENTGFTIMNARVKAIAEEGFKPAKLKVDSLIKNLDNYYIINYWPMDKYALGHIPGAIQFQPKKTLKKDKALTNLPVDKPIAVYCYTGQHSAFVAAYLRVLGYDAKTLLYGANGFMHAKMQSEIGKAFNAVTHVKDYPLIPGDKPSLKSIAATPANNETKIKPVSKTPPPKKKKKKVEDEGGC